MDVNLIDWAHDPLSKLYGAFRTCYSQKPSREIWEEIASGKIPAEDIRKFVAERLSTGHASPLEQVVFWFGITGVSRALSHQFVRHRIGISFEQQSQRYVRYKEDKLDFIMPRTWSRAGAEMEKEYEDLMAHISRTYQKALDSGIPAEDARFVLPNATPTNFQVMVNLAELLHIGDLRLCHRAQWEIRYMVGLMRAEVRRVVPELAAVMQPKCGEHRMGYCDESIKDYHACPLSKVRPHKSQVLLQFAESKLSENDIQPKGTDRS